jgi:hypothetical protein
VPVGSVVPIKFIMWVILIIWWEHQTSRHSRTEWSLS